MQNKKFISNNLLAARLEARLKQKEVATMLGVKWEDRISLWEQGKGVPNIFNLFKLCQIYRRLPHELYPALVYQETGSEPQTPSSVTPIK